MAEPMPVIVAARLSKLQADGQVGIGIESQDIRASGWAEEHDMHVLHVAADVKSGTVAPVDRPNLQPWLTDPVLLASYRAIVCYATDRLSRGAQEDFSRIEAWAADHGKLLIIAEGGRGIYFPARDDADYWQWASAKRLARAEWERIQKRTRDGLDTIRTKARAEDRSPVTGKVPWGYVSTGAKYHKAVVITADGELFIPQIFRRIADGQSLATVARWLAAEGAGAGDPRPRRWWPASVKKIVTNRAYHGRRTDGGQEVACPPLVGVALWESANAMLRQRKPRGPVSRERPMLSTVLWCDLCAAGDCESPMYRVRRQDKAVAGYYRCWERTKRPHRRVGGCGMQVRTERAEAAVDEVVRGRFAGWQITELAWVAGTTHADAIANLQRDYRQLSGRGLSYTDEDAERARLRGEIERLTDLDRDAEPGRWVRTPVRDDYGHVLTIGVVWPVLTAGERGAWLRRQGFRVLAGRDYIRVTHPDAPAPGVVVPIEPTARARPA